MSELDSASDLFFLLSADAPLIPVHRTGGFRCGLNKYWRFEKEGGYSHGGYV
jgi:hypothetical protein